MRLAWTTSLLIGLHMASLARADEKPLVVSLWPDKAPDEPGTIGAEKIRMSPKQDRKRVEVTEPTRLVTNVTKPTLTIYRPAKDKDTGTAVVICPGGGYWDLYWQLEGEEVAAWLNSQGITGIILKYRVPRRPDEPQGEPARRPLQDAQRAISLVRSKARAWGIAADRIGMVGFSAGGHLAVATATSFEKRTYKPIDAIDEVSCRPDFAILVYSGYLKAKDKDELAPGLRIPKGTPPIFLAHGGDDIISSPLHSVVMYLALKRAGVPAELHIYAKAAHDFGVRPSDHPCSTWTRSCAEWLRHQGFLTVGPKSRLRYSARAASAKPQAASETAWVESSGHRVVRLSSEPGSSSFYFHQNAYTASGDKMVIYTRNGLSTIDLKTHKNEPLVEGRVRNAIVGKKTRQVFYLKEGAVYATHLDTGTTRKVASLPPEWRGGSGLAINADETLLAGSATEVKGKAVGRKPAVSGKGSLEARCAARVPMVLYTIEIQNGVVKKIHQGDDWFNHVQFSPTDPNLLMFCHEGPWHKVDRIWTLRTDGTGLRKIHTRTMDMEIAGHEFFGPDGKAIWYDLQTPKGKEFWLAGVVLATGEKIRYKVERPHWSVHYTPSPDGKRFAGDGGGPRSVAAPQNGQAIYFFTPDKGALKAEKLVDLAKHNYALEPNVTFTPDGRWLVFRSNMHGPSHVYAVEVRKSKEEK